jgi:hypothetical protein
MDSSSCPAHPAAPATRLGCPSRRAFAAWLISTPVLLTASAAPGVEREAAADEVMRNLNARARGTSSRTELDMVMRGPRGEHRKRVLVERRQFGLAYRTIFWIVRPEHEQGIGLLLSEDEDARGMWMYFPLTRQTIHVVSRGLSALATDFSCEDLLATVPMQDYNFRILGRERFADGVALRVEMRPHTERLQQELGFANSIGWVREDIPMIVQAEYLDADGQVFKRFRTGDVAMIDGIWTARGFSMENLRANHRTEIRVASVDYFVDPASALYRPADAFTSARFGNGFTLPPK